VGRSVGIAAGIARQLATDGWDLALNFWSPYDNRMPWANVAPHHEELVREQAGRVRNEQAADAVIQKVELGRQRRIGVTAALRAGASVWRPSYDRGSFVWTSRGAAARIGWAASRRLTQIATKIGVLRVSPARYRDHSYRDHSQNPLTG